MVYQTIARRVAGVALVSLLLSGAASANPSMLGDFNFNHPIFIHAHPFARLRLVIQVSEANPARWVLALNSAQNVLDYLGAQRVQIVIVAYGPGLLMLLAHSPDAKRISSMNDEGIEFDACHNTMEGMFHATGHMPVLLPQAVIVPAGVVRIMQLESHGFNYIKP
ncbi:DsrE family protein [Acidiphilium sp.]|uniref:DsrE family protein n=1 Tax=Acidiphilium sp. TaxID=527 RepID=UPI003CFC0E10